MTFKLVEIPHDVVTIVLDQSGKRRFGVAVGNCIIGVFDTKQESADAVRAYLRLGDGETPWRSRKSRIKDVLSVARHLANFNSDGRNIRNIKRVLEKCYLGADLLTVCAELVLLADSRERWATFAALNVTGALRQSDMPTDITDGDAGQQSQAAFNVDALSSEVLSAMHKTFSAGGKSFKKKQASAGGYAKYKKHPTAKEFVQHEWLQHSEAYEGNKSAFARDYVRRVKNELDVTVTEKTLREVWLRTPVASKQAG